MLQQHKGRSGNATNMHKGMRLLIILNDAALHGMHCTALKLLVAMCCSSIDSSG